MNSIQSTTTRLCLVRHGETDWNAAKRLQGQLDIDLNAVGEIQAQAVRPEVSGQSFAAVYSSDLTRAWRTALLATEGSGIPAVLPAPTLRERHYGVFQGLTADEARLSLPQAHRHHAARSLDYDYGTGESLRAFAARVMDGLAVIAIRHPGATVLGFTHGGVLDIVYRAATGRSLETPRDFPVPNAALNWVEYRAGTWALLSWADRSHLDRALDEVVE